jgi:PAS domain S-box-containing protein
LTHPPPSSAADLTALSREQAAAAFDRHDAPEEWLKDKARFAILSPPGFLVSATPAMLALFGAKNCEALEARLVRGDGPSARRLRRLAATLPLGELRLEQMRFIVDRRPASVNLHCVRIAGPGGATWLLVSVPALGVARNAPPAPAEDREAPRADDMTAPDLGGRPPPRSAGAPPPNSRFLWTLDEEGRFGMVHPVLVAAVGANAPHRGESVEALLRRARLDGGDELARALGERQTFSGVTVEWPLPGLDRRRLIALSAAPMFGSQREFLGYRGFGVLGEEIEAVAVSEGHVTAELAEDHRSALPETFEPMPLWPASEFEAEVRPSAGESIEPSFEFPPTDDPDGAPSEAYIEADGSESAPPLTEAFEPEASWPARELEAEVQAPENAAKLVEPNRGLPPTDVPDAPLPETSLERDGPKSAPDLTEVSDSDARAAETAQPDLAERPAASEPQPSLPERTAAIYILRHPAPAVPSNIVPIRPGALDALARESAQSFPAESVELSRSERDAFREIARALVGRAPASRDDPSDERAGADNRRELGVDTRAEQSTDRQGDAAAARGADDDEVRRNAGAVLDRLPVGALVARDGRALYANRTLLELIGYRDFAEFQAANALSRMFRDRDPQGMAAEEVGAVAIVRADGQILSVDGHAQVIGWDGAPATLIALRRSLEAELRARMRVAESEAAANRSGLASGDLQAMLDRASDGAVTLDLAGRILSLNEPAERLFGYHQNEIAGESLLMLLAPQSHPEATARLEALSRGGEAEAASRPLQVVGRDRSGASIPLALTLARIGPSEAPQFCALVRDLSRERETERRLIAAREAAEAASAAKTDFLAQVSHEIRTPLHAILGFAEVMLEERFGPVGNERYKDYIKDIHASGSHVMSLADDLLDLSKIEAGKLELAFASVDANSVIRECVSLMQPQAARERVIMRVSLHDRLPRVMVDERSLKQIMLNLMSNAVKFNEPGGQVIVSTAVDAAGQAVIRVRDTGVGMNENEVGLALTPFSQVGKAGAKGGAGLGLPLTKALVEANKAEFSIKSRREQGTLIEIAFPNIQAAQ